MSVVRVTGAVFLAALVLACTADDARAPSPPAGPPAETPEPGLVGSRPAKWDRAVVEGDGTRLRVEYVGGSGACGRLAAVDVEERTAAVVVTVVVGDRPGAGRCGDVGETTAATATLREPLGQRDVIDGADPLASRPVVRP